MRAHHSGWKLPWKSFLFTACFVFAAVIALCFATDGARAAGTGNSGAGSLARTAGPAVNPAGKTALRPVSGQRRAAVVKSYFKLPLSFIVNRGQVNRRVSFYEKGDGHTTFFTRKAIVLSLEKPAATSGPIPGQKGAAVKPPGTKIARNSVSFLRIAMPGMNKHVQIVPEEEMGGKVNYFIGNDPHKWRTNIPTYRAVLYKNAWPGIDIKFYGNNSRLEYDIIARPGSDPSVVKFTYSGAKGVRLTRSGNLAVELAGGRLIQQKPVVYQQIDGRRIMRRGAFVVRAQKASAGRKASLRTFTCSFELGRYDTKAPLVVDPTLVYSTYLGGSNEDNASGIGVDASGNVYVAGWTHSTDFPVTAGAFQTSMKNLSSQAFVTEVAPGGKSLVYSTFLGGSNTGGANGIAVDASGDAYVTGWTASSDFPVTSGAFHTSPQSVICGTVPFVTELAAGGAHLVYSTYLSLYVNPYCESPSHSGAAGIAIDASGNAYITGTTNSNDFPVTAGAFQTTYKAPQDAAEGNAFVTELAAGGKSLVYSTYLGGTVDDQAIGIAIDASGNAYVTGWAASPDFPVTAGAFQTTFINNPDGYNTFVTEVAAGGKSLVYSTFLSGSHGSGSYGIAVDASGNAYVTGGTSSADFPVTSGAFQTTLGGSGFGASFVTEIAAGGKSLVYSTFLDDSTGGGIAIDASGNAYVTGGAGAGFPVTADALQTTTILGSGAFVTELAAGGKSLVYSTLLGGDLYTVGTGIALDRSGNFYVTGDTQSLNGFPLTSGAFQTTIKNALDYQVGFVAEFGPGGGLWQSATPTGGGWYYLSPFGAFNTNGSPWIYHQTLGWLYPVGTTTDSIWFYDPQWDGAGGWWWSSSSFFPWVYSVTEKEWLYYDAKDSTLSTRWFFNTAGQATTH